MIIINKNGYSINSESLKEKTKRNKNSPNFCQSENCVYFHKERIKTRKKYMA